ncbi:MAG: transporter associated domain-containing protein [Chloroflexota bacterium]|nr:transporter associated domain-containing protein [Chloroflexota bacterium]
MLMESTLPREEADTLGGLMYPRLGRVPRRGDVVEIDDVLLTVEQAGEHRVEKV